MFSAVYSYAARRFSEGDAAETEGRGRGGLRRRYPLRYGPCGLIVISGKRFSQTISPFVVALGNKHNHPVLSITFVPSQLIFYLTGGTCSLLCTCSYACSKRRSIRLHGTKYWTTRWEKWQGKWQTYWSRQWLWYLLCLPKNRELSTWFFLQILARSHFRWTRREIFSSPLHET